MAGLIAPGIARYTVHGTYAGRNIANVLDFLITPGGGVDRADCVAHQAAVLVSAWADEIVENIVNNYTANSVSWVDLDSALGTVGETTIGTGTDFPVSGTGVDTAMPGNVAYRINKAIVAARGQRQGRMYLVGVPESSTSDAAPNTVDSTVRAALDVDLAAFLAVVSVAPGGSPDMFSELHVVHTRITDPGPPAVIEYEGSSPVTGLTTDATLASQRRRLRG